MPGRADAPHMRWGVEHTLLDGLSARHGRWPRDLGPGRRPIRIACTRSRGHRAAPQGAPSPGPTCGATVPGASAHLQDAPSDRNGGCSPDHSMAPMHGKAEPAAVRAGGRSVAAPLVSATTGDSGALKKQLRCDAAACRAEPGEKQPGEDEGPGGLTRRIGVGGWSIRFWTACPLCTAGGRSVSGLVSATTGGRGACLLARQAAAGTMAGPRTTRVACARSRGQADRRRSRTRPRCGSRPGC